MNKVKIDRRRKYILVIDVETINGFSAVPFVYDIGIVMTDKLGRVYEKYSFFNSDADLSSKNSLYYQHKRSIINYELQAGVRKKASTLKIRNFIMELMKKYECRTICGHNIVFDLRSLDSTIKQVTAGGISDFFEYGPVFPELYDTMRMMQSCVSKRPTYKYYCERNNYIKKNGKPKLSLEVAYGYFVQEDGFKSNHSGLEDVLITVALLAFCLKIHSKMTKEVKYKKER